MIEGEAHPGAHVVECAQAFLPDEIDGFQKATLSLPSEGDGDLAATLVRTKVEGGDSRPAVLYVHGYIDYFFQVHLAQAFEQAGFRFYAIDLRRYGRSLRDGNRPGQAKIISDYFVELDWAVTSIKSQHPRLAAIVAHSTGGLISSLYLHTRRGQNLAERLVLCSPFLRFNLGTIVLAQSRIAALVGRVLPNLKLPQKLNPVYGMTLHKSHGGEWDYDLIKKPIGGFPLYAGWFRVIWAAHTQVARGLDIDVPILALHSGQSRVAGKSPTPADKCADIVLNVSHIKALGPRLGKDVTLVEVPDGVHDLTLSSRAARETTIGAMVRFVDKPRDTNPPA